MYVRPGGGSTCWIGASGLCSRPCRAFAGFANDIFPNIFFSIALKMPDSLQDKALRDEFVKWIEYAADDGALHNTIVRNNHFWKLLHHFDLATIVADPIFLNAWSECIALRNITYSLGVDIPMATHHGTLKSIDPTPRTYQETSPNNNPDKL